jgi:hypothetical protein
MSYLWDLDVETLSAMLLAVQFHEADVRVAEEATVMKPPFTSTEFNMYRLTFKEISNWRQLATGASSSGDDKHTRLVISEGIRVPTAQPTEVADALRRAIHAGGRVKDDLVKWSLSKAEGVWEYAAHLMRRYAHSRLSADVDASYLLRRADVGFRGATEPTVVTAEATAPKTTVKGVTSQISQYKIPEGAPSRGLGVNHPATMSKVATVPPARMLAMSGGAMGDSGAMGGGGEVHVQIREGVVVPIEALTQLFAVWAGNHSTPPAAPGVTPYVQREATFDGARRFGDRSRVNKRPHWLPEGEYACVGSVPGAPITEDDETKVPCEFCMRNGDPRGAEKHSAQYCSTRKPSIKPFLTAYVERRREVARGWSQRPPTTLTPAPAVTATSNPPVTPVAAPKDSSAATQVAAQ